MEEPAPFLIDCDERAVLCRALSMMIETLDTGYGWENRQAQVDAAQKLLARLQQDPG